VHTVLAPNPGLMTGPGTNQYLLGAAAGPALLVDVAPYDAENARRLAAALDAAGSRLGRIVLTHIHPDHVGGALALRDATGAPIVVHRRRADFQVGGRPLAPDQVVEDGDEIAYPGGRLRAVHTPGHESGHVCWYDPGTRRLFTGDLILGTGTTVVAPPDGDMIAYLESLRRLQALELVELLPGHGAAISSPYAKIAEYLAHRAEREAQILAGLAAGLDAVPALVEHIYTALHPGLRPVAGLQVRAHLEKLATEGRARETDGRWRLAS
jgi:glyoxylase-like metal-dependent hydrolase (beta-lactamase superfamily II)